MNGRKIVVALGGNALGNTPKEQLELVKNTALITSLEKAADGIEEKTGTVIFVE